MIQASLAFDEGGRLVRIETRGHAPKPLLMELVSPKANAYNAVCSAVSALEYTLAASVKELTDATAEAVFQKGLFRFRVSARGTRPEILDALLSSFTIGLSLLEARHGDVLRIQHPPSAS